MTCSLYYSSKDIMLILGIGRRKANEIMHMFEARGMMFRCGKTMRVRITYFTEWLNSKDGQEHSKAVMVDRLRRMA